MAKLNWRFLREEDSLWARVIRGKYSSPLRNQYYSPSFLWRSMCKGYPLMTAGSRKIIHNGRSTLFWTDNWLGSGDWPFELEAWWRVLLISCDELLLTVRDVWASRPVRLDRIWFPSVYLLSLSNKLEGFPFHGYVRMMTSLCGINSNSGIFCSTTACI